MLYAPGYLVRVYREGYKRLHGLLRVVRVEGKDIFVYWDGRLAHYNISQEIPENKFSGDHILQAVHASLQTFLHIRHLMPHEVAPASRDEKLDPRVAFLFGLSNGSSKVYQGPRTRTRLQNNASQLIIMELLHRRDPRRHIPWLG